MLTELASSFFLVTVKYVVVYVWLRSSDCLPSVQLKIKFLYDFVID